MTIRFTPGALAALMLAGCFEPQNQKEDPSVVATVDGELITRDDFERELAREAQALEGGPRTPEQMAPYKQALLDTLVERVLVLKAAQAAGVTVSPDEVDRRVLALASEYPAGGFDAALASSQTSRAAMARAVRDRLTIEKHLQANVLSRVAVTEEQIRQYYLDHAGEFTQSEQVHAQQIVVKGLDEARRIQQQLWQGKKFADLARRYSLSADAKVGGDLGFFERGQMPPAFDEVLFKLPVGSTSEVVSTEYGFHLFRVLERRPGRKRELAEVRGLIEQRLLSGLRTEAQAAYVASLRGKATIKVNEAAFQAATVRPAAPAPGPGPGEP